MLGGVLQNLPPLTAGHVSARGGICCRWCTAELPATYCRSCERERGDELGGVLQNLPPLTAALWQKSRPITKSYRAH